MADPKARRPKDMSVETEATCAARFAQRGFTGLHRRGHSLYSGDCDSLYPMVRSRFRFLLLASWVGPGCAIDTFGATDSVGSSSSTSPTTASTTQTDSTTESDSLNTSETPTTTEDTGSSDPTEVTTGPLPECENCDAVGVAAGDDQTCAWNSNGELYCWGQAGSFALGYTMEALNGEFRIGDDERPIDMGPVPAGGPVVHAATDFGITCAVFENGKLKCWGQLAGYAYGHMETIYSAADAEDVDLEAVAAVDVAAKFGCALLTNGDVYCWGLNNIGQLGLGHTDAIGDDELPKTAGPVSLGRPATQIALDDSHACAVLNDGSVRCWGAGGRLGIGNLETIGDDELPTSVDPVDLGGRRAVHLSIDTLGTTCVTVESGNVYCWGLNVIGYGDVPEQVGITYTPDQWGPIDLGRSFSRISPGSGTPCGVADGDVVCWGLNQYGMIGDPNASVCTSCFDDCCATPPSHVVTVEVGGDAIDVVGGWAHKCALLKDGSVRCWGNGWSGQLGYGNITVHACQLPMQTPSCETEAPCCIGDDETPASAGPVPLQ